MPVYISLLRGINVGGNKKIKMAELKTLYETMGFTSVSTLLQSGNVVFESDSADVDQIGSTIESSIEQHYGFQSKIIMRTRDQWQAVIDNHPYSADQLTEPSKILIAFLQDVANSDAFNTLLEAHTGPEIIHNGGQELYIFYPNGMGRSKLDHSFIERKLKITTTGRNWNTVNKLLKLAESL